MPALDLQAAHEYWKNYQDPMIYRVVQMMEGMEDWTADGNPVLEAAINQLGQALDETDKFALANEHSFIALSANLKATRFLRLLQAIDQVEPGAASRLLLFAEENTAHHDDLAGLFLRRNVVFERLRLLGRIFSAERFSLLIKALEGNAHD